MIWWKWFSNSNNYPAGHEQKASEIVAFCLYRIARMFRVEWKLLSHKQAVSNKFIHWQSGIVISFDNLDQNKSLTNRCTSFRSGDIIW